MEIKTIIRKIKIAAHRPRNKKIFYVLCVVALVLWVMFRFAVIGAENRLVVFNPARAAVTDGVPVAVLNMTPRDDILRTAIMVKNNRAFVSAARAHMLRAGQKIGDGTIASVAQNIDIDTGMYAVRTRGVADGLQLAEIPSNGFFVPVYALNNGAVFIVRDGVAVHTPVKIAAQDSDNALVSAGIKNGDIVILSRVNDGDKIQIKEHAN